MDLCVTPSRLAGTLVGRWLEQKCPEAATGQLRARACAAQSGTKVQVAGPGPRLPVTVLGGPAASGVLGFGGARLGGGALVGRLVPPSSPRARSMI
jgi:hypothetical protein